MSPLEKAFRDRVRGRLIALRVVNAEDNLDRMWERVTTRMPVPANRAQARRVAAMLRKGALDDQIDQIILIG